MAGIDALVDGRETPCENVSSTGVTKKPDSFPIAIRSGWQGREVAEIFEGARPWLGGFLWDLGEMAFCGVLQNELYKAVAIAFVHPGVRIDIVPVLVDRLSHGVDDSLRFRSDCLGE